MWEGIAVWWGDFQQVAPLYLPLGAIGGWRWSVWLIKKTMALFYRPVTGEYDAEVSVVTPVYNEDPEIFSRALRSWQIAGVDEVVAVIDHTDQRCLAVFREFAKGFAGAKEIVTEVPGKRPALARGTLAARGEIVALVDSDTIWDPAVRAECLKPFADPAVGGVTMRQVVIEAKTVAQRLYKVQQNIRFLDEYPFLTALGGSVVHCLSGRTAFYRRAALVPVLPDLENETFWGKPVISGDDKRLTYLIEERGWKTAYQKNAQVFMRGEPRMMVFLKQRLRWARNSWRADMRALTQRWTWREPYFAMYLVDRAIQPFTLMLGPIYFVLSLVYGVWLPAVTLLVWWHISRAVRLGSHFWRRPQDILLIPFYILFNFYSGLARIYALFTLNRQGWITRWDKSRLPQLRWLASLPAYGATMLVLVALSGTVLAYRGDILSDWSGGGVKVGKMGVANVTEQNVAGNALEDDKAVRWQTYLDRETNTVYVTEGERIVSLRGLKGVLPNNQLLEMAPGRWYLAVNLVLADDMTFDFSGINSILLGVDTVDKSQRVRIYQAGNAL